MILIKKMTLFLLFIGCFTSITRAQQVQIHEEPKVSHLMQNWVNHNRSEPRVDGWRAQIMASTDRAQVEQGRNRFRAEYPEVSATSVQEQPYYKLRAGAFRTKQEALAFISKLSGWSGAYPVKDGNIHPRDFLEQ